MAILAWIIIAVAILLLLGFGYWFFHKIQGQLTILLGISEMLQRESEPVLGQVENLQATLAEKQAQMEQVQVDFNKIKDQ
ncbi:hypothetical protein G7084_06260 [Weissella coleopterorum]|uniref:Uncharacterized protein n=1 Tax=Weissella coleopterorum TaxID=2714949 RepID=A0A6G8B167_9LACO|nr:hypothetical protein [Weissella coleopterorum]QIL50955.1 hypothetical protein G7084_06260 [Weissella coleopterorum]